MLKGQKVVLRAMERDDLKQLHILRQHVDLEIMGGGDWMPYSLAAMEKYFDKHIEREDNHRFIIEADNKIIGDIGLHHVDRANNCTSFGIGILDPDYLGKGYGRDAINVLLDYVFRIHSFRRIWLEVAATNPRAIGAYTACGFIQEGLLREHNFQEGQYIDAIVMGLLRTEWLSHRTKSVTE